MFWGKTNYQKLKSFPQKLFFCTICAKSVKKWIIRSMTSITDKSPRKQCFFTELIWQPQNFMLRLLQNKGGNWKQVTEFFSHQRISRFYYYLRHHPVCRRTQSSRVIEKCFQLAPREVSIAIFRGRYGAWWTVVLNWRNMACPTVNKESALLSIFEILRIDGNKLFAVMGENLCFQTQSRLCLKNKVFLPF